MIASPRLGKYFRYQADLNLVLLLGHFHFVTIEFFPSIKISLTVLRATYPRERSPPQEAPAIPSDDEICFFFVAPCISWIQRLWIQGMFCPFLYGATVPRNNSINDEHDNFDVSILPKVLWILLPNGRVLCNKKHDLVQGLKDELPQGFTSLYNGTCLRLRCA